MRTMHRRHEPLPAVTPDDPRLRPILDTLLHAGDRPIGFDELLDAGVFEPAHAIHELELAGFCVERVTIAAEGPRAHAFRLVSAGRRARRLRLRPRR